ncbi:hypothetical protein [Photobacterium ganghwense]|uniref:hypothetical protein n=1 Tax=Photobacterium ganghwense TaxID=320778 RepID=UPI001A901283|nr:hypothetical protein [Photobacterium ganghwense]QSV17320.1 hypothetical protein FH974_20550 [Photobacterium ganghwense]
MLPTNDLLFVAGAVQPANITHDHQASYDAGFLGFDFCGPRPEPITPETLWYLNRVNRDTAFYARKQNEHAESLPYVCAEHLREAAARSAENNRLVQGRKSPTHPQQASLNRLMAQQRKLETRDDELGSSEAYYNHDTLYGLTEAGNRARVLPPKGKPKVAEPTITPNVVRLMKRDWSGQRKIQYYTQTPSSAAPDAQQGERFTEKLTKRAVSKIFEAGAYVATCHGGFCTFLTLTFSQAERARIFSSMVEADDVNGDHTPVLITRNMAECVPHIAGAYCYIDTTADDPAATVDILDDGTVKVMNADGTIAGAYTPTFLKPEKLFTITKTAETTIGKEVSRFLDGAKKMYQRGWVANHTQEIDAESGAKYSQLTEKRIPGHSKPSEFGPTREAADFHYIWVAECPANDDGEPNPHVHVLLNWAVPQNLFPAWALRLENLWGKGFAHLERIKKPMAAGSYIIKAVGYAAKGDNADQGLIRGNRYNIARCSRAPAWECIASFQADNMAAIIKECGYRLEQWRKPINRRLKRLEKQLDQTIKAKAIAKQAKQDEQAINKLTARIIRLENQMRATRKAIKSREVHASTKNVFCMAFDGEQAEQKAFDFLLWAAGARGWGMTLVDDETELADSVTEARAVAQSEYAGQYLRHLDRRAYWQSVFRDPLAPPREPTDREIASAMAAREHYEQWQLAA